MVRGLVIILDWQPISAGEETAQGGHLMIRATSWNVDLSRDLECEGNQQAQHGEKGPAEGSCIQCTSGTLFVPFHLILTTFYGVDNTISSLCQETEALTRLMKPA